MYVGNQTHIQNFTVKTDLSPTTKILLGAHFVDASPALKVSHTDFHFANDKYLAIACFNCSGTSGIVQVWDYSNISSPRLLLDHRGNSSAGSFMIGEFIYLEPILPSFNQPA